MGDTFDTAVRLELDDTSSEVSSCGSDVSVVQQDGPQRASTYQKETQYLRLLPYYDEIVAEADHQLSVIKHGLASSILLRELRTGVLDWLFEFDAYVDLYSHRFTKADHVWFVDTFITLMGMPDLDLRVVLTISRMLSRLLGIRKELSPTDITIQWRPLYELYKMVRFKTSYDLGLRIPSGMASAVCKLIISSRDYFPPEATREILDEIRPLMCIWEPSMFERGIHLLQLFLPTCLSAEDHRRFGAKLWFDEFWFWYESIENSPSWESNVLSCFSRLALESPQFVAEWSPSQLDLLFSRFLRSFGLQLGGDLDPVEIGDGDSAFPGQLAARFYSCTLGGSDNTVQRYLSRFFDAVQSYMHPSNEGSWQDDILIFIRKLARAVCLRLRRERYQKPDWSPMPDRSKFLTDQQVDTLVESLLPCVLLGMFGKDNKDLSSRAIRYLAYLAPKLVVPAVLEKVYPALETLTEPHRLQQSLRCLGAVGVSLVRGDGSVVEGQLQRRVHEMKVGEFGATNRDLRCHVFGLLIKLLPGLDPNDISKTMVTFKTLSFFCLLVPLVDCSEAVRLRNDLTDDEKELCSATAFLDEFANQLMDRIFTLILTSGMQNHSVASGGGVRAAINLSGHVQHSSDDEKLHESVVIVFTAFISNCSSAIYEIGKSRLYNFVKENVCDSRLAADAVGKMILSTIESNPTDSLPLFLNFLIQKISALITENTWKEGETDPCLLWYLILTSHLARTSGNELIKCETQLLRLLELVVPLSSREAYIVVETLLECLLLALTTVYTIKDDNKRRSLDQPLDKYLPIRHWVDTVDKKHTTIPWHVPSSAELDFVDTIFDRIFITELKRLDTPVDLSKDALLRSLCLVKACVCGVSCLLPPLEGTAVSTVDTLQTMEAFQYHLMPRCVRHVTLSGRNVRNVVFETLNRLLDYMLVNREDDALSLTAISRIYGHLIFLRGLDDSVDTGDAIRSRKLLGDPIRGRKADVKSVVELFANIQQQKRQLMLSGFSFNSTHQTLVSDLLRLAISDYKHIRRDAHTQIEKCFNLFPLVYRLYLDRLVKYLVKDENVTEEQFVGVLELMMNGDTPLFVRQTWRTLLTTWPALISAQHFDKATTISLIDSSFVTIVEGLKSFQIRFQMPDGVDVVAKRLWDDPKLASCTVVPPKPSDDLIAKGRAAEVKRSDDNEKTYYELLEKLLKLSTDPNLHWRHTDMAQSLLGLLLRRDQRCPCEVVQLFVQLLVHDRIVIRVVASMFVRYWLRMQKPKALKVPYTPNPPPDRSKLVGGEWPIRWGITEDVEPLMYRQDQLPADQSKWDQMIFVDKPYLGVYVWPSCRQLMIYKSASEQCRRNWSQDQLLTDADKTLVNCFNDKNFLLKFVHLSSFTLEDKNDNTFEETNCELFQDIFRNYADACLETMKPVLETLMVSAKEREQRLAAEIVAGLIHGSKLWNFTKTEALWKWLKPVLQKTFEQHITSETTVTNWATALVVAVSARDPRRLHWLVEMLFESVEKPNESPFHTKTRFFLLHSCMNSMGFRVMGCWRRLWTITLPLLHSSSSTVRSRVGRWLSWMISFHLADAHLAVSVESLMPPTIEQLFASVEVKLELILADAFATSINGGSIENGGGTTPPQESENHKRKTESKEWKEAVSLLKTLLVFTSSYWGLCSRSLPSPLLSVMLPLVCHTENEAVDDELRTAAQSQLKHGFATAAICSAAKADECLRRCEQIFTTTTRWKCKVSMLRYLQVAVFSNFFRYASSLTTVEQLEQLVFKALSDVRLEVRECASEVLSGLILSGLLPVNDKLLKRCRALAAVSPSTDMRRCHAGVLGLSAIVTACPYSVPPFLPMVLMNLCRLVILPPPIRSTVKKTLSEFKRTHQDSWHEHKTNFSDDQLAVLTDLLISHNYYV